MGSENGQNYPGFRGGGRRGGRGPKRGHIFGLGGRDRRKNALERHQWGALKKSSAAFRLTESRLTESHDLIHRPDREEE